MTLSMLYTGRWEDVFDELGFKVDHVITDAPYDLVYFDLPAFRQMTDYKGNVISFSSPENQLFKPDERAYWIKTPSTKNNTASRKLSRFVEPILISRGETFNTGLHWSNYTGVYTDMLEGERLYEWQKPLALVERLIRIYTKPGEIILDPYAGTGTTLLAAQNLGRLAVGVELDPGRAELARQRLGW